MSGVIYWIVHSSDYLNKFGNYAVLYINNLSFDDFYGAMNSICKSDNKLKILNVLLYNGLSAFNTMKYLLSQIDSFDNEAFDLCLPYFKDRNKSMSDKNILLSIAVNNCHESAARIFIELGADVDTNEDDADGPVIYLAIRNDMRSFTEFLLDQGASVNPYHFNLIDTVAETFPLYLPLLMEYGADVLSPNALGFTPLFHLLDHREIFIQVLSAGANINHISRQGDTILSRFVRIENYSDNHINRVEFLLNHGADPKIANPITKLLKFDVLKKREITVIVVKH